MDLQSNCCSAGVVALVTFVWLFSYLGHVNPEMSCELVLSSVSFVAFSAPERLLPSVILLKNLNLTYSEVM